MWRVTRQSAKFATVIFTVSYIATVQKIHSRIAISVAPAFFSFSFRSREYTAAPFALQGRWVKDLRYFCFEFSLHLEGFMSRSLTNLPPPGNGSCLPAGNRHSDSVLSLQRRRSEEVLLVSLIFVLRNKGLSQNRSHKIVRISQKKIQKFARRSQMKQKIHSKLLETF